MTELTRLPGNASCDDVVEIIRRDGGVIVEDFLTAEKLGAVKADLLPKVAAIDPGANEFIGRRTRRLSALFKHSRHMVDIAMHPLFLGPAEVLIDVPVSYWGGERTLQPGVRIGATQLIQIGPGEPAQRLHRDDWSFMWRHPAYGREARLQVMLAVSRFTAANGGTLVIPGSHLWDDDRIPKDSEAISTEMEPGSALLWLGSLYHGGGANTTTDEYRSGLTMTLDAGNVRQEENMYLALSDEVLRSYPEEVQALLGWRLAKDSYMGWVEINGHLSDPIELLRAGGRPT
jgi:hypothetical protein